MTPEDSSSMCDDTISALSSEGDNDIESISESSEDRELLRTNLTPVTARDALRIEFREINSPTSVSDTAIFDTSMVSLSFLNEKSKTKSLLPACTDSNPPPPLPDTLENSPSHSVRKRRKRVCFAEKCVVWDTISWRDLTSQEIRRTWLTSKDYDRMQVRDDVITEMIVTGKSVGTVCIRGLESKIAGRAQKKKSSRELGVNDVLAEQDRQWDSYKKEHGDHEYFFYDSDTFAYIYSQVSEEAHIRAQDVARQDRLDVEKILAAPFVRSEHRRSLHLRLK